MFDLVIKNAMLQDREETVDIGMKSGKISFVGKLSDEQSKDILDAQGSLVTAPFVQSHVHLDSALTSGEPKFNESGTLFEGIDIWAKRREWITEEDIRQRAIKAIKWHIGQGILHIRSHVDICDPNLTAVKALLSVKQELAPYVTLQLVAFPQEGIVSYPDGEKLMEEALKLGVDVIGGAPHLEFTREDGVESIKKIFNLAEKYNSLIDVHCDEIDDEQSRFLETVAALAIRTGLKDRVTASHTTAMHSYNNAYASKLLNLCKKSEINFIANPLSNITLQGRFDTYPKRRGITRVKEIQERGLNISLGSDNILDPFYGLGTANMLQVANMCIHVSQLTGVQDMKNVFKMITSNGAKTLKIEESYGVEVGMPANLVVLDAFDEMDALRMQSVAKVVISNGNIISKTQPSRTDVYLNGESEYITYRK